MLPKAAERNVHKGKIQSSTEQEPRTTQKRNEIDMSGTRESEIWKQSKPTEGRTHEKIRKLDVNTVERVIELVRKTPRRPQMAMPVLWEAEAAPCYQKTEGFGTHVRPGGCRVPAAAAPLGLRGDAP